MHGRGSAPFATPAAKKCPNIRCITAYHHFTTIPCRFYYFTLMNNVTSGNETMVQGITTNERIAKLEEQELTMLKKKTVKLEEPEQG